MSFGALMQPLVMEFKSIYHQAVLEAFKINR